MDSAGIELRQTCDFDSMVKLAKGAGLEIEQLGPTLAAYGLFEGEEMVGCACLKEHDGVFLVECLAIIERLRGNGLGTRLVRIVEADARRRGAKSIHALARRPEFFLKIGYREAHPDETSYPSTGSCRECPQFGNTCSPAVVVKDL